MSGYPHALRSGSPGCHFQEADRVGIRHRLTRHADGHAMGLTWPCRVRIGDLDRCQTPHRHRHRARGCERVSDTKAVGSAAAAK